MDNQKREITATDEALQDLGNGGEAFMFQNQFFPEGEFHVASTELEGFPTPEGVGEGNIGVSFDNRLIQYTNKQSTFAFFFPYEDAEIQQGVLYRLGGDWEDIGEEDGNGGGDTPTSNLVNVTFKPIAGSDDDWLNDRDL